MARYATSQGKGPKGNKNKDTLKASVHYKRNRDGTVTRTQLNDGDDTVYTMGGSAHKGKRGTARPNLIRHETKKKMSGKAAYKDQEGKIDQKAREKKYQAEQKRKAADVKRRKQEQTKANEQRALMYQRKLEEIKARKAKAKPKPKPKPAPKAKRLTEAQRQANIAAAAKRKKMAEEMKRRFARSVGK